MHAGQKYSFQEVLFWTRRDLFRLLLISSIPVIAYQVLGWKWIALPWLPVALLGTAVAFVVGFKNNASYDRLWEARRIWGSIVNVSRSWGIMTKDFISNRHVQLPLSEEALQQEKHKLIRIHLAWLTALRYQLREARIWEGIYKKHNAEFKDRWFKVEEHNNKIEDALAAYLSPDELYTVLTKTNRAANLLAMQSDNLKKLLEAGLIEDFRHMEMQKLLVELFNHQGGSERIKNFPYPRQYATINAYFIHIFVVLVPFGMLNEFEKLGDCMVWLSIPFSTLSTWIFTTLEKIGEASESPFEGSANDVPLTAMCRNIEIDLKEMLQMPDVPKPIKPENNILV